jgi:diguanylate cyclase (GGDEF)-like protein
MRAAAGDPDELVVLGAFVGVQVLVACFSLLVARAYRERPLLVHAAAGLLALFTLQAVAGAHAVYPELLMLLVLAAAGMQLRELAAHAGAVQQPRRWLVDISLGLVPALAAATLLVPWLLLPGLALWAGVAAVVLARIWPQSAPWRWWLLPGLLALGSAAAWLALQRFEESPQGLLVLAGLMAVWSACVFLASVWRSRIVGETRARSDARSRIDPLTGLATLLVLDERVEAARTLMRRYGHPSVLMLVHIDNLARLAREFGAQAAEDAMLAAATRIRQSLREGDVAARVAHHHIAVLAEGVAPAEAAANVASRILVAGLREPLPSLPAEFLHFRIVLGVVPASHAPARALLELLESRLALELAAPSERHIVTLPSEAMVAAG